MIYYTTMNSQLSSLGISKTGGKYSKEQVTYVNVFWKQIVYRASFETEPLSTQ